MIRICKKKKTILGVYNLVLSFILSFYCPSVTFGKFTNTTTIINNDSIKNITGTNIAYVMPHIIVIKNNKCLMFDECDDTYVNTFKIKISFKDLEGKSHKKLQTSTIKKIF